MILLRVERESDFYESDEPLNKAHETILGFWIFVSDFN